METPARQVAVLSDVHGVLPALESVLAEPEVATADRIVLTGDLAAGPQPRQTLDLLASLGDRAVWIRGNADRELVQLARGEVSTVPDPIAPWAAAQLRGLHAHRRGILLPRGRGMGGLLPERAGQRCGGTGRHGPAGRPPRLSAHIIAGGAAGWGHGPPQPHGRAAPGLPA